jgi:hypothetical protein
MKKIIPLLLVCIFTLWGCGGNENELSAFSKECGIDLTSGTLISSDDTHGGFHGDGRLLIATQYTDDFLCEEMEENEYWKELPLSQNLQTFIYESAGETLSIPEIKNGYYYFYDRHSESTDSYDDTKLFDRKSFNFTFAIYDIDEHTLYWCKYDT